MAPFLLTCTKSLASVFELTEAPFLVESRGMTFLLNPCGDDLESGELLLMGVRFGFAGWLGNE
ncbi:hypothetical protein DSM106972_068460 [Dulcicalothrix desertica PCC 7102]|uniref:Uncharacterized protein n=1 Tax=Dulcicalothrix desertica PCC 7102 TaxID=232991 RepID=A0A433V5E4_9CYAN|nr:hypothetical protein DSM106972_068460 [Dulcicalothrix desertica PCC 7102]